MGKQLHRPLTPFAKATVAHNAPVSREPILTKERLYFQAILEGISNSPEAIPYGVAQDSPFPSDPYKSPQFAGIWGSAAIPSIKLTRAYPVSSATISAWRGRTFPGRSSSSSAVFPTRQPAVPTSSRPDGLTDSTVPRVDLSGRRRCRGGCSGSAHGHSGDGAPQDQDPHPSLVLGCLSDQHRDARHLRTAAAAPARTQALRDGLDDAPQVAPGDGGTRAVPAHWPGRGR